MYCYIVAHSSLTNVNVRKNGFSHGILVVHTIILFFKKVVPQLFNPEKDVRLFVHDP